MERRFSNQQHRRLESRRYIAAQGEARGPLGLGGRFVPANACVSFAVSLAFCQTGKKNADSDARTETAGHSPFQRCNGLVRTGQPDGSDSGVGENLGGKPQPSGRSGTDLANSGGRKEVGGSAGNIP